MQVACEETNGGGAALILMREARSDEALEEGVWRVGFGSEFGMELAGKKPRMILDFNELDQSPVG